MKAAALAAGIVFTSASAVLSQSTAPNFEPKLEEIETLPEGKGREQAFYNCTACHAFKLVAAQAMTRQNWDDTIQQMIDRHKMNAPSLEDLALILDYLEKQYPPRAPSGGWRNPFAQ
jgi:hypothetical protein